MKTTKTEILECKYRYILDELNRRCYDCVTQQDLADYFHVSRRKINEFINGKTIDFKLLNSYANICGMELKLELVELDLKNIKIN
jgi:hypothetical protein